MKKSLWFRGLVMTTSVIALACSSKAEHSGTADCGPVPAEIEARFAAMRGPLGCAASQTMIDPPGGCSGADALLTDVRRNYDELRREANCASVPLSLAPVVSAYNEGFRAEHAFVAHEIRRDGFTISAREFGANADAKAPTIVLMHGFPDNQHLYDRVAPALGQHHRVITFDFLGWGDSTTPPADFAYGFDEQRKDLEAVLAYFDVTSAVPVVHDASGWPGIDWALDNPESVAALVLLNTVYNPVPSQAPPNVIRAASAPDLRPAFIAAVGTDELMSRALLRAQVSRFFVDADQASVFLPLFERYALSTGTGIFALTATLVQTLMARAAEVPRMKGFARPVTVAFGADDPYLNVATAEAFATTFPLSKLELLQGAGHYVQLDAPDKVIAAVEAAADGR